MNFDIKIPSLNSFKKENIAGGLATIWQKVRFIIFSVVMVIVFVFGFYVWHKNLSGNSWSQERKANFLKQQAKDISFREEEFKKVIEDVQLRKKPSNENYEILRDIFTTFK